MPVSKKAGTCSLPGFPSSSLPVLHRFSTRQPIGGWSHIENENEEPVENATAIPTLAAAYQDVGKEGR